MAIASAVRREHTEGQIAKVHRITDRQVADRPRVSKRAQDNCRCQTKSDAGDSERHPFAEDETEISRGGWPSAGRAPRPGGPGSIPPAG
jgi:hypothetical protein